jgi:hypothetical protein
MFNTVKKLTHMLVAQISETDTLREEKTEVAGNTSGNGA